jgi:hypothetical protein
MKDPAESFFAFLFGVALTLTVFTFACDPPHQTVRDQITAAMGCTVISAAEAAPGVEGLSPSAVYWRCKDGKVYVR